MSFTGSATARTNWVQAALMTGLVLAAFTVHAQEKPAATAYPKVVDSITLYLTFDDGIIPGTEALNELTIAEQVPLTVFWIGKFVLRNDTTRRIWQSLQANPLVEAGNHSFSHANSHYFKYYNNPLQVLSDFRTNQDSLQFTTKLVRLPGRNAWRIDGRSRDDLSDCKAVADSLAKNGYRVLGWDLEWNYTAAANQLEPADDLLFRISQALTFHRTFTPGQVVILCHDPALSNASSIATLQQFIRQARQQGFRFRSLGQYQGLR